MRTFIAIDLDPEIKRSLSDFVRRLKKASPEGTSWAREAGMHFTLKFLGEIDDAGSEAVSRAMDEAVKPGRPFLVQVLGTGVFPNARFPRVLWVGIAPSAELDSLQTRLESALAEAGFERETRPFHPHLTLGRVRSVPGVRSALTELELQKHTEFGTMTAAKIALFRSVLRPDGAEYTILKESLFP